MSKEALAPETSDNTVEAFLEEVGDVTCVAKRLHYYVDNRSTQSDTNRWRLTITNEDGSDRFVCIYSLNNFLRVFHYNTPHDFHLTAGALNAYQLSNVMEWLIEGKVEKVIRIAKPKNWLVLRP